MTPSVVVGRDDHGVDCADRRRDTRPSAAAPRTTTAGGSAGVDFRGPRYFRPAGGFTDGRACVVFESADRAVFLWRNRSETPCGMTLAAVEALVHEELLWKEIKASEVRACRR